MLYATIVIYKKLNKLTRSDSEITLSVKNTLYFLKFSANFAETSYETR